MSAPASAFQKLPGRGLGWTGRGCLWLAGDHLLEATSAVVMERYRRFFFGEIRAIIVRRTRVRGRRRARAFDRHGVAMVPGVKSWK